MATRGQGKASKAKRAPRTAFNPRHLDRTVIAIPLLDDLKTKRTALHVIIDLNLDFDGGVRRARKVVERMIDEIVAARKKRPKDLGVRDLDSGDDESGNGTQYVFACLDREAIRELVRRDQQQSKEKSKRAIYHVWPDFKVRPLITRSICTVKVDAIHNAFAAFGTGIVWAVLDSGIDGTHPHFRMHENLVLPEPLQHRDFTSARGDARIDVLGHGTHVAGIIAGGMNSSIGTITAMSVERDERGQTVPVKTDLQVISGMAPRCKLLSLKVVDDEGQGEASAVIRALQYVQRLNEHGRRIRVHGVNMSVGYPFDPEWFACGQSPLCVEVNRLVKSGVVVVVSAGNAGYGFLQTKFVNVMATSMDLTIEDPGNAELAITVGSTHRDMPHTYGVSYFSSKGPTGDGRLKPDLLAPGEKIISCASAGVTTTKDVDRALKAPVKNLKGQYREDSGTSEAAPHVSGAIAAFLSVRREFIQQPEEVKRIFLETATDLKRVRDFQGHGLIDAMRAIQSV